MSAWWDALVQVGCSWGGRVGESQTLALALPAVKSWCAGQECSTAGAEDSVAAEACEALS